MNIINYIRECCKPFQKMETWKGYFFVFFITSNFKDYITSYIKALFQGSLTNPYVLEIFLGFVVVFGLMLSTIIYKVLNDIYLRVKEYLIKNGVIGKKKEKLEKERKEYLSSKNIKIVFLQDLDVWARKNNCYDKVPEALWEELRVAEKRSKINYGGFEKIPLEVLKERYIRLHFQIEIVKKIIKLLENNKSN